MNALERYTQKQRLSSALSLSLEKNASLSTILNVGRRGLGVVSRIAARGAKNVSKASKAVRSLKTTVTGRPLVSKVTGLPVKGQSSTWIGSTFNLPKNLKGYRNTFRWQKDMPKWSIPKTKKTSLVDSKVLSYRNRPSPKVDPLMARRQYLKRVGEGLILPGSYAATHKVLNESKAAKRSARRIGHGVGRVINSAKRSIEALRGGPGRMQ